MIFYYEKNDLKFLDDVPFHKNSKRLKDLAESNKLQNPKLELLIKSFLFVLNIFLYLLFEITNFIELYMLESFKALEKSLPSLQIRRKYGIVLKDVAHAWFIIFIFIKYVIRYTRTYFFYLLLFSPLSLPL